MKYIITESKINNFITTYLDGQDWYTWDMQDGEFNVSEGQYGIDLFKYRIQYSSMDSDHEFEVIYLNEILIKKISKIFSISPHDSIRSIIGWFNQKYNKNLTIENLELFEDETNDEY